jgi:DNA-directed RNA polymerase specialized sigma24 family protein
VEAIVEPQRVFDDFYRVERTTILRAVVYALEDADLGAEATDEAWARAYERWDDVGAMANPAGWVFRVAVNHGRNRRRRQLLERRTPPPPDCDRPDVEALADPALARALARLPLDQRTAIVLRFHLDWSIDAIAESLGCAPRDREEPAAPRAAAAGVDAGGTGMTGPTDLPIEHRLRAHYANRAAQEPLSGLDADRALARARAVAERGEPGTGRDGDRRGQDKRASSRLGMPLAPQRGGVVQLVRRQPVRAAGVAAVAVALAIAAGVVAQDDPSRVTTDPAPGPTTPPTSAPESAEGSRPTGPIVSAEGILGTWSSSEWVPWQSGDVPPVGDEFRIVRLDEPITTAVGEAGAGCAVTDEYGGVDVGLEYGSQPFASRSIAVAGVVDPRPRPVEVLDASAAVYRESAAAVVAGLGISDPAPQVVQAVRSDLDGDGVAEDVVVAERVHDPTRLVGSADDYAVVFLRQGAGGDVETSVIASSIASSIDDPLPGRAPVIDLYRLSALADLNGDGRMEIVLNGGWYEGSWTAVHELRPDGTAPEVLYVQCGT